MCGAALEYTLFKEDALMNDYPTLVKEKLYSLIDDIADISWLYCNNPGHNFTRNRKLDFATTMKLIIAMEGGTVSE